MTPQPPRDRAARNVTGEPNGSAGEAILAAYDGIVCDLDGVVYRGEDAVPDAPEALRDIVTHGTRVVYATNNASRVPAEVAAHVAELGAPATEADIVTSAQAGAALLASHLPQGAAVLALGGAGLVEALTRAGLRPVAPGEATTAEPDPGTDREAAHPSESAEQPEADDQQLRVSAVLQGLGPDLTVRDFQTASRFVAADITWVATNTDSTLPLQWGLAPGNGAYVDLLTTATGRQPEVVGKPFAPLYELAMQRLGSGHDRTLAVGDRLGTDIEGADAAGIDAAWVLTGVDRPSDLLRTTLAPRYVIGALSELLQPYAAPVRTDDGWVCGKARAHLRPHGLEVDGAGPATSDGTDGTIGGRSTMDAVRAGLAALVEARDGGESPDRLAELAGVLDELMGPAR